MNSCFFFLQRRENELKIQQAAEEDQNALEEKERQVAEAKAKKAKEDVDVLLARLGQLRARLNGVSAEAENIVGGVNEMKIEDVDTAAQTELTNERKSVLQEGSTLDEKSSALTQEVQKLAQSAEALLKDDGKVKEILDGESVSKKAAAEVLKLLQDLTPPAVDDKLLKFENGDDSEKGVSGLEDDGRKGVARLKALQTKLDHAKKLFEMRAHYLAFKAFEGIYKEFEKSETEDVKLDFTLEGMSKKWFMPADLDFTLEKMSKLFMAAHVKNLSLLDARQKEGLLLQERINAAKGNLGALMQKDERKDIDTAVKVKEKLRALETKYVKRKENVEDEVKLVKSTKNQAKKKQESIANGFETLGVDATGVLPADQNVNVEDKFQEFQAGPKQGWLDLAGILNVAVLGDYELGEYKKAMEALEHDILDLASNFEQLEEHFREQRRAE